MRQLTTNDVFKMSRILKKLELKSTEINIDGDSKNYDEQLGIAVILKAAENLHLAQNEINDFLGDLCGMTGADFGKLPIKESIKYIQEFKDLDGVSDFFKYAGQLMK